MLGTIRAGLVYFALVLGAGFALGTVRVPFIVPRIGERWAELAKMPIMAVVVFFAAGYVLRRFPDVRFRGRSLVAGLFALTLAICAELGLAVALQEPNARRVPRRPRQGLWFCLPRLAGSVRSHAKASSTSL
jgi:hypothetical protein